MSEQKQERWLKVDLHVHSLASTDCGQEGGSLLSILRRAEEMSLDIVGLVDHNSVRGYEQLRLEMSRLAVLKEAGRLAAEEEAIWAEYQRLLTRLLLLPGFELTTQEGVHLLVLFPSETPAEWLYALLLNLGIPMEKLREGSADTHAQADVAATCALVSQAGGMVIAAHTDADHGSDLAKETDLPAGLLALEVVSLPEELPAGPCIYMWFSNAHCLHGRPEGPHPWGVGERYTEILLESSSFEGLRNLLVQRENWRVRFPEGERLRAYLEQLRRQSPERLILYGAEVDPAQVYQDVAALANSGGGVLMVGLGEEGVIGVADPESWSAVLTRSVREQVAPAPRLNLELLRFEGKEVIRVEVHVEAPPPYVTAAGVVAVRVKGETRPATRAELLELAAAGMPMPAQAGGGSAPSGGLDLPQAGVEIVGAYLRDGVWFYDVRDLRVTSGVTRQRAKGLWAYAIERQEAMRQARVDISQIRWKGDRGIWRAYRSGERRVFDLAHRDASGRVDHLFYGVSEWGLTPRWREVVEAVHPPLEEDAGPPIQGEEGEEHGPREPKAVRGTARRVPAAAREVTGGDVPAREEAVVAVVPSEQAVAEAVPPEEAVATVANGAEGTPASETAVAVTPAEGVAGEPAAEAPDQAAPLRPSPDSWGGRIPRWRIQAAVERVYWESSNLLFDLAMRQEGDQVRYFRHVNRNQLTGAEGWVDLVRVPLPPSGVEVVRSTASGEEVLYQFRDMQTGRVDPRVRRNSDFSSDSPYAYAIRMFHQDVPLDENQVRWWGNIGYLRRDGDRVDLVYRDEEGRDHIYYAAECSLLDGEWKEMLQVWKEG